MFIIVNIQGERSWEINIPVSAVVVCRASIINIEDFELYKELIKFEKDLKFGQ